MITECSITLSNRYFIPEIISGSNAIDAEISNVTNSLLRNSSIPNNKVSIGRLGECTGYWNFFSRLYNVERSNIFDYTPLFLIPSTNLDVLHSFSRNHLDDSKISVRVLYYPFGLFTVRIRAYLKFSESKSPEEVVEIRDSLEENLYHSRRSENSVIISSKTPGWNSNGDLESMIRECVRWSFGGEIPDHHSSRFSDILTHETTYIYDNINLDDADIATLVSGDIRANSNEHISRWSTPQFGNLKKDTIVTKKQGSVLVTPYFSGVNSDSRRWKRIQLLNNKYLSTDFALFEKQFGNAVLKELDLLLDSISDGNFVGDPIKPYNLVMIREALTFGSSLRGIRHRFYEEIAPNESKVDEVDNYIDRIIDHNSKLREGVKTLLPGVF